MTDTKYVYTKEEIAATDKSAIEYGIPSLELMENAASGAYMHIMSRYPDPRKIIVVCGGGNNGGDGYAIARMMKNDGLNVGVLKACEPKSPDCVFQAEKYESAGGEYALISDLDDCDLITDAVFGFSFSGEFRPGYKEIINAMNLSRANKVSIDLPSGASADGRVCNGCFKADMTVTFTANKIGTASYPAYGYCGEVRVQDIGIPFNVFPSEKPKIEIISDIKKYLPERKKNSNKGTFGTLCVFAGCEDMPGAAYLCLTGALCSGVGMVKFASDKPTTEIMKHRIAEPVYIHDGIDGIESANCTALTLGCGIGGEYDEKKLENILVNSKIPTVIDADGINFISRNIDILRRMKCQKALTPHPKEMSRLCNLSVERINSDRVGIAKSFAKEYNAYVLLKGDRTVIAAPDGRVRINTSGSHALAKCGSGDVLAGVAGSLAAQGCDLFDALTAAAYVHGKAGEICERKYGACGSRASYLPEEIGRILG